MINNKEYDKFTKLLSKEYFTLNELRNFVDNDFVSNISKEKSDNEHKKFTKYSVKLVDGDIYYVYVKA